MKYRIHSVRVHISELKFFAGFSNENRCNSKALSGQELSGTKYSLARIFFSCSSSPISIAILLALVSSTIAFEDVRYGNEMLRTRPSKVISSSFERVTRGETAVDLSLKLFNFWLISPAMQGMNCGRISFENRPIPNPFNSLDNCNPRL